MKRASALDVRTWIEIDRRSLFFNLRQFQRRAKPANLMAVVKSNAYGHGLSLVAKLLSSEKLEIGNQKLWFGADSITEALRLRKDGIKNPILVLGYTLPARFREAARKRITITISSFEGLNTYATTKIRPAFHVKFDTGMHRHGFQESELPELIRTLRAHRLTPAGAYSHLAVATDRAFSKQQFGAFDRCLRALRDAGIRPAVIHCNKTEGILFYPRRDTLARLGIGLYGYLPDAGRPIRGRASGQRVPPRGFVRPVLSWKTVVSEVKRVKKGERIGYDLTYRFPRDATIAVLPIGYWHGFDRGLSNRGEVLIRGKRAPVRGRICMDITMVEVTDIPGVRVGDEAILIGKQGEERITADDIGRAIDTTSYEVLTRINPLIKKIVR